MGKAGRRGQQFVTICSVRESPNRYYESLETSKDLRDSTFSFGKCLKYTQRQIGPSLNHEIRRFIIIAHVPTR